MSYEIGELIELRDRAARARDAADELVAHAREQIERSRALVIRTAELIADTPPSVPNRPAPSHSRLS